MANEFNATCSICGDRYYVCSTCKSTKTLKPWRTITDTVDCYKIYMIIHDYKIGTITKENAKKMLDKCSMPNKFQPHIKAVIDEIMVVDKKDKLETKKGIADNLKNNE